MSVRVVHLLEMIEIDKNDRKLVVITLRAVDFRLQDEAHVPRIVQRRAVVLDGQLVNSLHVARILESDGGKVRERFQQFQVARIEALGSDAIDQLDYAQTGIAKLYGHRDDRLRFGFCFFVDFPEESRVLCRVRHDHGLAVLRHPTGDSLPQLDAHVFQRLRGFAYRQFEVQFLRGFVEQQQRPVVRPQELVNLFHDGAENLIELQRRRQRLPQLLENGDLALFALLERHRGIAAAIDGRKRLYFFHAGLNLSPEKILRHFLCFPRKAVHRIAAAATQRRFAQSEHTTSNLRQYRPLVKSYAIRSWYRRGYLAILATLVQVTTPHCLLTASFDSSLPARL